MKKIQLETKKRPKLKKLFEPIAERWKITIKVLKTKLWRLRCKYVYRLPLNDISIKCLRDYKRDLKFTYSERIKKFKAMSRFMEQHFLPLPKHWEYSTNYYQLWIYHYEGNSEDKPLETFLSFYDKLQELGRLKEVEFLDVKKVFNQSLDISGTLKYKGVTFNILISQFQIDKCEIKYERKYTKVPVLTGFCAEALKENQPNIKKEVNK